MVSGTLVMLASTVHIVAKYYHRPKRSSNKIRILQTKFEFEKNEFNIPKQDITGCVNFAQNITNVCNNNKRGSFVTQ